MTIKNNNKINNADLIHDINNSLLILKYNLGSLKNKLPPSKLLNESLEELNNIENKINGIN